MRPKKKLSLFNELQGNEESPSMILGSLDCSASHSALTHHSWSWSQPFAISQRAPTPRRCSLALCLWQYPSTSSFFSHVATPCFVPPTKREDRLTAWNDCFWLIVINCVILPQWRPGSKLKAVTALNGFLLTAVLVRVTCLSKLEAFRWDSVEQYFEAEAQTSQS